jgi:hypothetical protein
VDLDSLMQLLVILGAGLYWLLGGARKGQSGSRPPPGPRPRARTGAGRGPRRAGAGGIRTPTGIERERWQGQVRRQPEPAAPRREGTLEDLYRILTGEPLGGPPPEEVPAAEDVRPPEIEAAPLEQIPEVEARSLETLEAAGEASHKRFHQQYIAVPEVPRRSARRARLRLRPASALEGILWREVLGPPKGLG